MKISISKEASAYLRYNKSLSRKWEKTFYRKPKYMDIFYHIPMGDEYHVIKLEDIYEPVLYLDKEAYDFISLLDGLNTFNEAWEKHAQLYPGSSKSEALDLLGKLDFLDLIIEGVVDDSAIDVSTNYYQRQERQVRFFAHFETDKFNRWDYQKKIKDSKIIVLGAGGTGSQALLYLAASGFINITCVDFDNVEVTNLNRQIIYKQEDVGKSKIFQAEKRMKEFNPEVNFNAIHEKISNTDRIIELMKGHDLCFCCADVPPILIRKKINLASLIAKIPVIYGGIYADHVNIGPLVVPYKTGCFSCWNEARKQINPDYEKYLAYILEKEEKTGTSASNVWLYGTTGAGIAMGIGGMVMDVMRYISGYSTPVTMGKQLKINLLSLDIEKINWPRIDSCPDCGKNINF